MRRQNRTTHLFPEPAVRDSVRAAVDWHENAVILGGHARSSDPQPTARDVGQIHFAPEPVHWRQVTVRLRDRWSAVAAQPCVVLVAQRLALGGLVATVEGAGAAVVGGGVLHVRGTGTPVQLVVRMAHAAALMFPFAPSDGAQLHAPILGRRPIVGQVHTPRPA